MSTESVFFNEKTGLKEIVTDYFYEGLPTLKLKTLNMYNGHQISLSTLKKRFKALGLHRVSLIQWRASADEVNYAVQKELDASGANLRYHRIWVGLKKQKILVRKKDVWKTILELNTEGIQQRKGRKLVRQKYC